MKMYITTGAFFCYRNWDVHISRHWSGHKFKVYITPIVPSPIEYNFMVRPHWYVNEDWDKAKQLAMKYIDENFGDAPFKI